MIGIGQLRRNAPLTLHTFLEANTMQLSYRGVKYNTSQPAIEITETQEIGHYRGATYPIRAISFSMK